MNQQTILITGASGQLGQSVLRHLRTLTDPQHIVALVRDPSKGVPLEAQGFRVRVGNYDDLDSLNAAMKGVDRVLLISGNELGKTVNQHANVLKAAASQGVKWVGYTSRALRRADDSENGVMDHHRQTEVLIRDSGLDYGILRNALYLDSLKYYIAGREKDPDLFLPADVGRVAFALRDELGEAIAQLLAQDNLPSNHTFTLTASTAWSFYDVALALSDLEGREVHYHPVTKPEYETRMRGFGIAEAVIQRTYGFYADIRDGQLDEIRPDLTTLLGRAPIGLAEGLKRVLATE